MGHRIARQCFESMPKSVSKVQMSSFGFLKRICCDHGSFDRDVMRDQLSQIVGRMGGRASVAGFGKLELTAPSLARSYDKKRLDQLIIDLATDAPELAQLVAACRTESPRAGSLRITREKPAG